MLSLCGPSKRSRLVLEDAATNVKNEESGTARVEPTLERSLTEGTNRKIFTSYSEWEA